MPIPLAAISAGIGVAGKIFGKHPKRPDNRRAIAELRASRPTGYVTPEDLIAASRLRGRQVEGVNAAAGQEGYQIGRRSQARGLAGSPSEERSRARLEQERLLGVEHAGEAGEDYLSNLRTGREAFQHQNDLNIFSAQVGENARGAARQDAQQGAFWNSLNEFMPAIMGGLNPGTAPGELPSYQGAVQGVNIQTPGLDKLKPLGFNPESRPSGF